MNKYKWQQQELSGDQISTLSQLALDTSLVERDSLGVIVPICDEFPDNPFKCQALRFVEMQFDLFPGTREKMIIVFKSFSNQGLLLVLRDYRFKTRSFFFLSDNGMALFEVTWWVWFGLICSLLYKVTEIIRTKGKKEFNPNEVPVHFAKMLYAPLSAIIIFLSFGTLVETEDILYSMGNGVIALSFILGFFSGRTIELLEKLKNILLPLGNTEGDRGTQPVRNFLLSGKVIAKKATGDLFEGMDFTKVSLEYKSETDPVPKSVTVDASGVFEINDLIPGWYTFTGMYSNGTSVFHLELPFEIKNEDVLNEVFELQESYSEPT